MANQWDERAMLAAVEPMLLPGETLEAAVYCSFYETGFFASRIPTGGYLALTGNGRLVGVKIGLLGSESFAADLATVTKIRIRQNIFQKLGNQTEVQLEYLSTRDSGRLSFTLIPKIVGGKLPHQAEYAGRILDELRMVSGALK